MAFIENARAWVRRQRAPGTLAILGLLVASAVAAFFFRALPSLLVAAYGERPWAVLTYPFAYVLSGGGPFGPIFFVLLLFWGFFVIASAEREMGTVRMLAMWAWFTLAPILLLFATFAATGGGTLVGGPTMPLAAFAVAWGVRNRELPVLLMGIVPLKGLYIAILAAIGVFLEMGQVRPLYGFVAVLPLAFVAAWAMERLPLPWPGGYRAERLPTKAQVARESALEEEVRRRRREREEQERLRKLLESPPAGDDR